MPEEETASVRVRKAVIPEAKVAAYRAGKSLTDWISEAIQEKLDRLSAEASK